MAESVEERAGRILAEKQYRVRFLVRETGITEDQAHRLIDLIGNEPSSLLREARNMRKK